MSTRPGSNTGRGRGTGQNYHRTTTQSNTPTTTTNSNGNTAHSSHNNGRNSQQRTHHNKHNGPSQRSNNPNHNNNNNNNDSNGQHKSHHHRQQQPQPIPISGVPYGFLPAFLPGSASLTEQLDQRVMIVLRDGRHLVGTLRSFDQFSNMVLEETSERRILHAKVAQSNDDGNGPAGGNEDDAEKTVICYYTDVQLGLYLVRGDSMVLLGEVDDEDTTDGDGNETQRAEDDRVASSTAVHAGLSGSGLLMGGKVNQRKDEMKTRMKKVSLEQFEELEKKIAKDGEQVDALTWEFDLDLAI